MLCKCSGFALRNAYITVLPYNLSIEAFFLRLGYECSDILHIKRDLFRVVPRATKLTDMGKLQSRLLPNSVG
jgi:hypothetical protein